MKATQTHSIVAVKVGRHFYVIHYDPKRPGPAFLQLGLWACDRQLNMSWYAAAWASNQIRLAMEK